MLYPLLVLTALAAAAPETHVLEHPSLTSYSVDPDTAWVDHSRPILKKEAIHQLVELFAAGRFRGPPAPLLLYLVGSQYVSACCLAQRIQTCRR